MSSCFHNNRPTVVETLNPFSNYLKGNLSMKEGNLFCFVVMRFTEPGCFRSCSWCLWKALDEEGVHGLGSMSFGLAVQKLLNIE